MSEPLSAAELAGLRAELTRSEDEGRIGWWGERYLRLLATLDATTDRAEQAESERDEAREHHENAVEATTEWARRSAAMEQRAEQAESTVERLLAALRELEEAVTAVNESEARWTSALNASSSVIIPNPDPDIDTPHSRLTAAVHAARAALDPATSEEGL